MQKERPEIADDVMDLLGEICDRCRYPLLEKDKERLICEHCDTCPMETMLLKLSAKAHLHGQILAAQEIIRGADPERLRG